MGTETNVIFLSHVSSSCINITSGGLALGDFFDQGTFTGLPGAIEENHRGILEGREELRAQNSFIHR